MDIYLILVMLVLPGPDAPRMELHRKLITAPSFSVCQNHADKLAEEVKKANEEVIKKQASKVIARCYTAGTMA